MSCYCKHEPCANIIRAYQNYELICTKEGYFEIVYAPKICVKQRLIDISNDRRMVRVIIKLINFERICFENICLVNELKPKPCDIIINHIDGLWYYENGMLVVSFPEIRELSSLTIDYVACFDKAYEIESAIFIKDELNNNDNGKMKKCKMSIKL